MAADVDWDFSQWVQGFGRLQTAIQTAARVGISKIGNEALRLASFEVPHDKGMLQSSSATEPVNDTEIIIGFNKVYAARLHEHPEYRFQKGRKGKYLEDPIKHNLNAFLGFMQSEVNDVLNNKV